MALLLNCARILPPCVSFGSIVEAVAGGWELDWFRCRAKGGLILKDDRDGLPRSIGTKQLLENGYGV